MRWYALALYIVAVYALIAGALVLLGEPLSLALVAAGASMLPGAGLAVLGLLLGTIIGRRGR